jgi:hypothetical protein
VSWGIVAPASGERHGISQAEMREIPRRAQAVADRVGGISVQMKIRTLPDHALPHNTYRTKVQISR